MAKWMPFRLRPSVFAKKSLDVALAELDVGNAVHEQAADAIGALEDRDLVAGTIELGGAGHPRRAGAHNRDLLTGAFGRRLGNDPAFLKSLIDDGTFDAF